MTGAPLKFEYRNLMSFLSHPLTPAQITEAHAGFAQDARHLSNLSLWTGIVLATALLLWAHALATPSRVLMIFIGVCAVFILVLPSLLIRADARYLREGCPSTWVVTADDGSISSLLALYSIISAAYISSEIGHLDSHWHWVIFLLFAVKAFVVHSRMSSLVTDKDLLAPASQGTHADAYEAAKKHPEVEQFRQNLLRDGREYLTAWEANAIFRFERDQASAERDLKKQEHSRRFLHDEEIVSEDSYRTSAPNSVGI